MATISLFKDFTTTIRASSLGATRWLEVPCDHWGALPCRFPKGNLGSGGQRLVQRSRRVHVSRTQFFSGAYFDGRHFRIASYAIFRRALIMHFMHCRA